MSAPEFAPAPEALRSVLALLAVSVLRGMSWLKKRLPHWQCPEAERLNLES